MPSVEHTPLLVNLLRLVRNGRSSNYEDHERGPVLFRFGGLDMSDTGPFTLAQIVWENAAWESMQSLELPNNYSETSNSNKISNEYNKSRVSDKATIVNSSFAGSLHLAVYIDGVQVELWTVEDYRERYTENSIPHNLNEIEELNSLVRIIYYHLRMQAVYGEIVQRCTRSVMLQNTNSLNNTVSNHNNFVHREHACEPHYEYEEQLSTHKHHVNTLHTERENNSLSNNTGIELCVYSHSTEHFPHVKSDYHHSELWAIEDLVRVTVVSDLLWESHIHDKMVMLNIPIALSTESLSQDVNKEANGEHACDALISCHECALLSPHSIKISHSCLHYEEEHIPEPLSACSCSDFTSFTPTSANATNKTLPTLALPSLMVSTINKTNCEKASPLLLSSTSPSLSLTETTITAQKKESSVMHSRQDKVCEQSNIYIDNNDEYNNVRESEQIQFQQLVHRMGHVFVTQSLLNFDAVNKFDIIKCNICVNPSTLTLTLTEKHEQYVNKTLEENTLIANSNMMAGNITSIAKVASKNQKCTFQSSSNEKSIMSIDNCEQRNDNNTPQKLLTICSHAKLQDCNKVTVAELLQYQLPAVFI